MAGNWDAGGNASLGLSAAPLLTSLAPGGPTATLEKFAQVVSEGRPDRGMPGFKGVLTPAQIQAIHAYLKGRAENRIPRVDRGVQGLIALHGY